MQTPQFLKSHAHADVPGSGVQRRLVELVLSRRTRAEAAHSEPSRNPVVIVPDPVARRRRATVPVTHVKQEVS
jgi:hypothetical protein